MMAETIEPTIEAPVEPIVEPVIEPAKVYTFDEQASFIEKMKDENAKNRIKNKELNDNLKVGNDAINALKKIEDDKLVAEGNFKELLEAKDKELAEYKTDKELLEKYEANFKQDLENELKGLGEVTAKIINDSNLSVVEKLNNARALMKERGLKAPSPASQRAGAPVTDTLGDDAIMKKYNETSDALEKLKLLEEIKLKKPLLYATI